MYEEEIKKYEIIYYFSLTERFVLFSYSFPSFLNHQTHPSIFITSTIISISNRHHLRKNRTPINLTFALISILQNFNYLFHFYFHSALREAYSSCILCKLFCRPFCLRSTNSVGICIL